MRPPYTWSDSREKSVAKAVTHNIEQVIQSLTLYQRTKLPKACRTFVNLIGYDMAKKYVPDYMNTVFENPNTLTLRSVNYKVVSNYEVQLSFRQNIGKGNDPANYLYPVLKDGGSSKKPAYSTKFTRFVHSAGIVPRNRYPVPVKEKLAKNTYGKVSQGEYTKTWSGLITSRPKSRRKSQLNPGLRGFNRASNYRYFSVPDNRNFGGVQTRQGSLFDLGEGIYRVKGRDNLQLLFTYAKQQPRVPTLFDYYGFVEKALVAKAPGTFRRALTEALR